MILLPATPFDATVLARNMRASDVHETEFTAVATGRIGPNWSVESDLLAALDLGPAWTFWQGDQMAGMGGVTPGPMRLGMAWFLGTPVADDHWRGMTRLCGGIVRVEADRFEAIGNMVPAHMTKRLRWLEFLGFDIVSNQAHLPLNGFVTFWSHPAKRPCDQSSRPH